MKKSLILVLMCVSAICLQAQVSPAGSAIVTGDSTLRAFDRHTKLLTIDIGASYFYHRTLNYQSYHGRNFGVWTGYVGIQPEYAIHRYWSIGFNIGVDWRLQTIRYYDFKYTGEAGELGVVMGVDAKFHFYQLIADRMDRSRKLHADKLDIYAGIEAGGGLAVHSCACPSHVITPVIDALGYVGAHIGVRYSLSRRVSIFGEIGYGKTIFNVGLAFKLGVNKEKRREQAAHHNPTWLEKKDY